jgi:hypothetical protein
VESIHYKKYRHRFVIRSICCEQGFNYYNSISMEYKYDKPKQSVLNSIHRTSSMVQGISWKTLIVAVFTKVYHCNLSCTTSFQPTIYFFKIRFNSILSYMSRSLQLSFILKFSNTICMRISPQASRCLGGSKEPVTVLRLLRYLAIDYACILR